MATYTELLHCSEDPTLNNKVRVALVIAAETIRIESDATPNHANRLIWARQVFEDPTLLAKRMLWAVLAQNKDASQATILSAGDSTIQSAVDAAVDVFAQ
jgi:hypothetical protein